MHVLVTGAAGFVGSHLVDTLLLQGDQVTALDNFDQFYPRAIKERNIAEHRRHPAWRLVELDVRSSTQLSDALSGGRYDAIVHLAAKAGVRPSIEEPLPYQDVNVTGTQNLLEFARTECIRQFVFGSSSSVYGVNPRVPWRETDQALLPISPYASTKVSGELLGHVYAHLYGIRFIALRLFTVYGPRQRPDLAIHKFAKLILDGRPVPMFGDGETRRDYTYVDDVVAGIRSAIAYTASPYEIINLGNDRTVSLRAMVAALERALGRSAAIEHHPEQLGDVPQTWADISKAQALLGYAPGVDFDEGIRNFVEWLLNSQTPGLPAAAQGLGAGIDGR